MVSQNAKTSKTTNADSVRAYLVEIGQIDLLTKNREVELGKQIHQAQPLWTLREEMEKTLQRTPTREEWQAASELPAKEFDRRLHIGNRAREKLIEANLRLVVSIAKKYLNRGVSFQDLIQEGSIGLMRAAEKFDFTKNCKFSTYAHWWIRQAVTRAISQQSRTVRLPVHLWESVGKIRKASRQFHAENNRYPTERELAELLEWSVDRVRQIRQHSQPIVSLNTKIGQDEDTELLDIQAASIKPIDGGLQLDWMREEIAARIEWAVKDDHSSEKARNIEMFRLRSGLVDGKGWKLSEIGEAYGVSRERVRQICQKIDRQLRQIARTQELDTHSI
ncbi:sigma-70 family RNA polymerase sigma factor [Leptolyngbya sp. FACHB-36]|uniref:sigma-70 family RNA polymerase sigma factor n=1 Tax=Leptolyngbya sp. FACHB-36 TaxID=2692808 RepID=UPI0016803262|nr:sigma-70 family RNA polymerase sigma factor [Leptolyngbya sp. FACHB-36]MBD2019393.1 sigma-70 family RNA polymerase sigma factor [Leptolyngbya sp. FACHB-36]